jgi:DNA polymerase (family 10)
MQLEKARAIADEIVSQLKPFCSKIEIAGSIRRRKSIVKDIDLVCIPSQTGQFICALQKMGLIKMGGKKLIRVELQYGYPEGLMLDIYIATAETWATLLLIRTGSTAHNIKLCRLALQKGLKLHADGSGLFKIEAQGCEGKEVLVANESEEQIFTALGLPYVSPEGRE